MSSDTGEVILKARIVPGNKQWLLLYFWAVMAVDKLWEIYRRVAAGYLLGWSSLLWLVFYVALVCVIFWPWQLRLTERGLSFNHPESIQRRYISWDNLSRWSWEGTTLQLTWSDLGNPDSAAIKLRTPDRKRVDQVIASRIRRD